MQYGAANNAMPMQGGWAKSSAEPCYHGRSDTQSVFKKGQRKRLNIVSILLALFGPWLLFCFISAVVSFGLHYVDPVVAYALVALAFFVFVAVPIVIAAERRRRHGQDQPWQDRSWFTFFAGACCLAFVSGAYFGEYNYESYMKPYYNLGHLHHYSGTDTNVNVGQQLMDAGSITFASGTVLDVAHSMGFKDHEVYCVAPIKSKGSARDSISIDFWAVGKNCCSGISADFHCEGFNDPEAVGAVRLMHDEDRPFYRLAVQQAEATYKMTATHPLFFEWVHNAEESIDKYAQRGRLNYFMAICGYFLFQGFLTAVMTLAFSTMVHF